MHTPKLLCLTAILACTSSTLFAAASPADTDSPTMAVQSQQLSQAQLQEEILSSRALIKKLASTLKHTLMSTVKSSGLEAGVKQCQISAPLISEGIEQDTNVIAIGRRSLKTRNPDNEPDKWQRLQLEKFDRAQSLGHKLGYSYRLLTHEGQAAMEFMSPIPTAGLCLSCHGEKLSLGVQKMLQKNYPNDHAIAYKAGDIRGAFTVVTLLKDQTE